MVDDSDGAELSISSGSVLLVSTQPWGFAGRLAGALHHAGFAVHGAVTNGCLLSHSGVLCGRHKLRHRALRDDLAAILRRVQPATVIACDDPAASALMALQAVPDLAALIAAAMGDPSSYAALGSKAQQMEVAHALGLPIPPTVQIADLDSLQTALAAARLPVVLKSDATSGGTGVVVIDDATMGSVAWTRLTSRLSLPFLVAALFRDRSLQAWVRWRNWQAPRVHLQQFVAGAPANRAVLCRDGEVLAGVSVEVLQTVYPGGPASVMRGIEHPGMTSSTAAMVRELKLSGLHGFDFVLEDGTGRAVLLEINPRATPIAAIALGAEGADLPGLLFTAVTGQPAATPRRTPGTEVAVFPAEWARDPASPYLRSAWHDVPWEDPPLLRAYLAKVYAQQRFEAIKARLAGFL